MQQTDSYIIVAHFHYVLGLGALFAIFAGVYYYWPKITGRMLNETLGKWHFWLAVWSFNATFFPMHFLGELGMPRRIYTYAPNMGWDFWNKWETWNAYIIALSFIPLLINIIISLTSGEVAGSDPWDARTLEWSVPTPPPMYNFAEVPTVTARDAFWVQKYGSVEASGLQGTSAVIAPSLVDISKIHIPLPSLYPLLIGLGLLLMSIGFLADWYRIVFMGVGLLVLGAISMSFEYKEWGEDNPHSVAESFLGLDHRKVGIWSFIGSECVFFASLISTYMVYKTRSLGPFDAYILNIPLTSFSTFVLLTSSLLMVLALAAFQRDDQKWGTIWLLGTAFFGCVFLGGQVYEFGDFWLEKGMDFNSNLFSQCFYTLVGFHGFHVFIGVVWLIVMAIAGMFGKLHAKRSLAVELCGLYWHFVDIVWVVIFVLVYLMRTVKGA
jgi:heme/copper-type cytochrome/quinol oxidase subunit 3